MYGTWLPLSILVAACARLQPAMTLDEARAQYATRNREACARLAAPPVSLIERIVANQLPHEAWKQAHPEAPKGSLLKSVIRDVIATHVPEVRKCYDEALVGWPNAQGRVHVRFGIDPTGAVAGVVIERDEPRIEPLGCCIAAAVRSWRFPAPNGGGFVMVTYPFVLEQVTALPFPLER
jgi:hypothetical protein